MKNVILTGFGNVYKEAVKWKERHESSCVMEESKMEIANDD